MSEKRFTLETILNCYVIKDNFKGDVYYNDLRLLCELLNEQQSTITKLEIELTDCKNRKEQSEYNLHKKIRELENKFEKIPPKIRELWVE